MNITLYNTKSPNNTVNKTLTNAYNITVQLKTPTNVLKPTIILGGVNITGYNYCYIPDFGRYYYISDMATEYANINERTLEVDSLMSWGSGIKGLFAIVERQQNFYNLYLPDLQFPNLAYKRVQTFTFPQQPLNIDGTLLLAVCGKG